MRASIMQGLLVAAFAVGCGGTAVEAEEPSDLAPREVNAASVVMCGNRNYFVTYYAEAERINVIGEGGCECGSYFQVTGSTSNWVRHLELRRCPYLP